MLREGRNSLSGFDIPQMLGRVLGVAAGSCCETTASGVSLCQLPGAHVCNTASKSNFL